MNPDNMHQLLNITWDMANGLELGSFTLRYYSLLFAGGFFAGYFVIKKMLASEKAPDAWLDALVTYMVISTVLGARLGHVFFYEWSYYKEHPGKILAVWEGGLASHGAAIAIIIAMFLFSKKVSKKSPLWILDRIVVVVALAGCFIRVGNYMNSEIYGSPGNSSIQTVYLDPSRQAILNSYGDKISEVTFKSTGQVLQTDSIAYPEYNMSLNFNQSMDANNAQLFVQRYVAARLNNQAPDDRNVWIAENASANRSAMGEDLIITIPVYGIPRYPTQIIEALAYLLTFVILYLLYWKTGRSKQSGYLFGTFLVLVFGFRFFVEFLKANQSSFEQGMLLNMGQLLSIPLVLAGIYFMFTSNKKHHDKHS
jgi:phosphatidylglycerol---prolipoprotein diacylglyceryl transferase